MSSPSIVPGRLTTPEQFLLCSEGQRTAAELYIVYKQAYNTVTYDWHLVQSQNPKVSQAFKTESLIQLE